MFPSWLAIVITFYFSLDSLWKLINVSSYCDYVSTTQYRCIIIDQQKNNRTLYHQNYDLTEKPVITFYFFYFFSILNNMIGLFMLR